MRQDHCRVLYAAGGCFWGTEHVFRALNGVVETTAGYANGHTEHPTYRQVCTDMTGHRETVRIVYDPQVIPLEKLLKAFFICVDPSVSNRQGNDIGSQYQTGIYYTDEETGKAVRAYFEEEKKRHPVFSTECGPLKCFYEAEEYHQDYLIRNPEGYCHITREEYDAVRRLNDE
ncbi:MAG: peptide-methionine (S)-S-oxide reductase MsrA [Solobacterium sp.]|nr:peptide-methionine (S)-S-oxide reductase MsrA [Solobacterium sp.]